LTKLALTIGWDDLLKCRAKVFVMEEEYRMQKAKEDKRKSSLPLSNENDSNDKTENESPKFENSSVKKPSQAAEDSNTPVRKWQNRESVFYSSNIIRKMKRRRTMRLKRK
jgi:hypothetical protein